MQQFNFLKNNIIFRKHYIYQFRNIRFNYNLLIHSSYSSSSEAYNNNQINLNKPPNFIATPIYYVNSSKQCNQI